MKVCHVTSVHSNHDTRIFYKECTSLALAGYNVYLVAKGESREENGVHVIGIGEESKNRLGRIVSFAKKAYEKAKELDCEIYHFHDPELLPYALKMYKQGKKVIFDSHEDVAEQIYDKEWIPKQVRKIISRVYYLYETYVVKQINAVVAATPYIGNTFVGRTKCVTVVNNFPKLDEIEFHTIPFIEREPILCFAGTISDSYGHSIMKRSVEDMKAVLIIAGDHEKELVGNIQYTGRLDRQGINDLYGRSIAGFCLNLPQKNFINSQPTKMFEYMAAGLPVICSDFPFWKKIIEKTEAGICVDLYNNQALKDAISLLLNNREYAQKLSNNGRKAVEDEYNWNNEEKTLLELYGKLR